MSESPVVIQCGDAQFEVNPSQTLLENALEQGVEIPNSCRAGVCHSCLVKVVSGDIPSEAQAGLSANQKLQNFALSCQLQPTSPLEIELGVKLSEYEVEVTGHQMLNEQVLRLRFKFEENWFPGQYLTLWKDDKTGRPYSIASLPSDDYLECHIRVYPSGKVSSWLKDNLKIGSTLNVSNPIGDCFYTDDMASKPILLVGYGTGLAPLYGIVRDALSRQHQHPIQLYVAGRNQQQLYYEQELKQLAMEHDGFQMQTIISDAADSTSMFSEIKKTVLAKHLELQNWNIFLCGAPDLVKILQKGCFLQGASMKDIHADPFVSGQ